MKRTPLVLGAAAAALALWALPAAATAHTDGLYSWGFDPTGGVPQGGYVAVSKTDASLSLVGASTFPEYTPATGMELCNEVGYSFSYDGNAAVATWDHATGEILSETPLGLDNGTVTYIQEADTLADCTLLGIAVIQSDNGDTQWVVSVDPATGGTARLVNLSEGIPGVTGIATAPDGTTYLFNDISDYPVIAPVDLATGTIGSWNQLEGWESLYESTGFSYGVDFDTAGGLWMITGVNALMQYRLITWAAGADLTTAVPTDVGAPPYTPGSGVFLTAPIPLAADVVAPAPAPEPQLAATGTGVPLGVVLAGGILVAAGSLLVVRRGRTT